MKAPRVHVHIDSIRLRGFSATDRDGIVAGLRNELRRLLASAAQDGAFKSARRSGVVNGGQLQLRPGAAAVGVGRTAARRIADRLRA